MFKNGTNIDKTSEGKNCQHSAKELFEEIEIDDSEEKISLPITLSLD